MSKSLSLLLIEIAGQAVESYHPFDDSPLTLFISLGTSYTCSSLGNHQKQTLTLEALI